MSEARSRRCAGLTSLDFQPSCRCGFNGTDAPLSDTLRRFEAAARQIEEELSLFFQQDKVKSRVLEWVKQGVEMNTATLAYAEGARPYPEIEQLPLFDQHMSGLELAHPVDAESLWSLLEGQVWERGALMKALDRFFAKAGERVVLRRQETPPRKDLVAWCYQQSLRSATNLPPVFSAAEQALAAEMISPAWIGSAALSDLETLELGEEPILRILDFMLQGTMRLTEKPPSRGPVAAALDLMRPTTPGCIEELAARVRCLYEQHPRFLKLRPREWLAHLDDLASMELPEPVDPIETRLRAHADAQWIVVDCLGLPLIETVAAVLAESMPHREHAPVEFVLVSPDTSTDSFYRGILGAGINRAFEKIDCIDRMLHQRALTMQDFDRLARAELTVALGNLLARIDPSKPVVLFGDHGFRLSADGREFTHGGPSTLERLTAIFRLH